MDIDWTVFSPNPDLQADVAALERSLEEERERCRAERQRRKALHNALVVTTRFLKTSPKVIKVNGKTAGRPSLPLFVLAAGVEGEHQSSLQGATASTLRLRPVVHLWIQVGQRMIRRGNINNWV